MKRYSGLIATFAGVVIGAVGMLVILTACGLIIVPREKARACEVVLKTTIYENGVSKTRTDCIQYNANR